MKTADRIKIASEYLKFYTDADVEDMVHEICRHEIPYGTVLGSEYWEKLSTKMRRGVEMVSGGNVALLTPLSEEHMVVISYVHRSIGSISMVDGQAIVIVDTHAFTEYMKMIFTVAKKDLEKELYKNKSFMEMLTDA